MLCRAVRAGGGAMVVWCLWCSLCFAQGPENIAVVCTGNGCGDFAGVQAFATLDAAITAAQTANSKIDTIIVGTGTWSSPTLPQLTKALTIVGEGATTEQIIEGSSTKPVFDINGADVTLEGLTISKGSVGVLISGACSPTISRCYITDNDSNGVTIAGGAAPLIVNTSIAENDGDGVFIESTAGYQPRLLLDSILKNGGGGVFVASGAKAQVRNTMVYQNSGGTRKLVYSFLFKNDNEPLPQWALEGEWQFGVPSGAGGTVFGKPDPTTGAPPPSSPAGGVQGNNVFGVNLAGDYALPTVDSSKAVFIGDVTPPAIPDAAQPSISIITVAQATPPLEISDVDVRVNIEHPRPSDLEIVLISPNDVRVVLTSRGEFAGATLEDVVFDDEADTTPPQPPDNLPRYMPDDALADIDGEFASSVTADGEWTLEVSDRVIGPTGQTAQILGWTLTFSKTEEITTNGDTITIPNDETTTTGEATVTGVLFPGTISDVNVTFNSLTHRDLADLGAVLISSEGTRVNLFHVGDLFGGEMDDTTFDSEAALLITQAPAPYRGDFRPVESLNDISGELAAGAWKLDVTNSTGDADGTLGWNVTIQADAAQAPVGNTQAVPILDQTEAVFRVLVNPPGVDNPLTDIDIAFDDLVHPRTEELEIILETPSGVQCVILSPDDADGPDLKGTIFDDDDAVRSIRGSDSPHSGFFLPHQPLSVFDGEAPFGNWRLHVRDVVPDKTPPTAGQQQLNRWRVLFNDPPTFYLTMPVTTTTTPPSGHDKTPLDFTDYYGVQLQFQRWLNCSENDEVSVEVSNNPGAADAIWIPVWTNKGDDVGEHVAFTDSTWQTVTYDISSIADTQAAVAVRWGYKGNFALDPKPFASGWNIDNIVFKAVHKDDVRAGIHADGDAASHATIKVRYNYVAHNLVNYFFVTPDSRSLDASDVDDPLLLSDEQWLGQLQLDSPLRDQGGNFVIEPFTGIDFDGDARPSDLGDSNPPNNNDGSLFDIGADEVGGAIDAVQWYYCRVAPSPLLILSDAGFPAGALLVDVRFASPFSGSAGDPGNFLAFVAPQGGDPSLLAHRILMNTIRAGMGRFICWNANTIPKTSVAPFVDNTPLGQLNNGDIIVDGHAAVYLEINGEIIGDDYAGDFSDNGRISGQNVYGALVGRHFLIDTVRPRMNIGSTTGVGAVDPNAGASLVRVLPPQVPPMFYGAPAAFPPYTMIFDGDYRPALPGFTTPHMGPMDDGVIRPQYAGSNGAQVFFNFGSVSNNYTPTPMDIAVQVSFIDEPPLGRIGDPPIVANRDLFTGLYTRQVVGLQESTEGAIRYGDAVDVLTNGDIVRWDIIEGRGKLAGVNAMSERGISSGSNPGWDFAAANGAVYDPENSASSMQWTFFDGSGAVFGIPYTAAQNQPFHLATRFYSVDPINPSAKPPVTEMLDPLHIWWLLSTDSVISPAVEGIELPRPYFTWQLDRGYDTKSAGILKPHFTYRLWMSDTPGDSDAAYNGLYQPVTEWVQWSDGATQLTPDFFEAFGDALENRYLLLVVAGADEAGNIESWPMGELAIDTNDNIAVLASSGRNWLRFYYPAPGLELDTSVAATFLNGASSIGWMSTIGWFPEIEIRFTVTMSSSTPDGLDPDAKIIWQLEGDGQVIAGGQPNVQTAPVDVTFDAERGVFRLTTINRQLLQRGVSYVFRASTYVDLDGDDVFDSDPLDPANSEPYDSSPATVTFTVVENTPADFFDPKDSPEDQPIKVQEEL